MLFRSIYYSVFSKNSQGEQTENVPDSNPKRHWNSLNLNEFQCLFCLIESPLIRTIVVSVTMYYSHPSRLAKSLIAKQNRSNCVNVISDGSPSRIRRVLRISFGMTILPRSSTRRTMPVAFIFSSPLKRKALFTPVEVFAGKGELCMKRPIGIGGKD